MSRPPLSAGSISLRLYPHDELSPTEQVRELRAQAAAAAGAGFDGIMTSEHHGGFAGYLPNPIQAAGWCLEAMDQAAGSAGATAWAAPCPLLLPLRPAGLVVEELAWLAARFEGRVGLGVAAGSRLEDFAVMGLDQADLTARFEAALALVAHGLGATAHPDTPAPRPDPDAVAVLGADPAVTRCGRDPVPVTSAAMSPAAVRRAAAHGVGILLDSLSGLDRARALIDAYHQGGGTQPATLIRRVWIGPPPEAELDRQVDRYRTYAAAGAQSHWVGDQLIAAPEVATVAQGLARATQGCGATALNLRVHAPGIGPDQVRAQIDLLGQVLDHEELADFRGAASGRTAR